MAPRALAGTAAPPGACTGSRGYQWKELFLPDGTQLRMQSDGDVHHARVEGDRIVFEGKHVSPRQLTLAIAGNGRNAWRDLMLRLPGELHFRPATVHRRVAQARIRVDAESGVGAVVAGGAAGSEAPALRAGRRGSPAETIAAAAQAMSDALRTALALVEHSNAQSLPKYERRVDFHRRAADVMADHVRYD